MPVTTAKGYELASADQTVLWRYMDLAKFSWLVLNSALYLPRSDLLGDPFEGSFSSAALNTQKSELLQQIESIEGDEAENKQIVKKVDLSFRRAQQAARYCWYISCWHMADHESAAMWRLYGLTDQAVAITTTAKKLADVFENASLGAVRYLDYSTDGWPPFNMLTPFLHKQNSYSHEREARILVHQSRDGDPRQNPVGITEKINPNSLIDRIYVSPEAKPFFSSVVETISKTAGIECKIQKSSLADNPLW